MAKRRPWMPLMIDDWRTSRRIACMDAWEERAYLRILMECWDSPDGWIQADDEMLAVVTRCGSRWGKCKEKVLACFELNNGMLSHPKLQELRKEADAVSEKRKKAAKTRWSSDANAVQTDCSGHAPCTGGAQTVQCHPQSQSQLQVKEKQEAQQQAAPAPEEPSRFAFACQYFQVSERLDADMATAFPWIDRQGEYRRMQAWCGANPTRAPRRQHGRFVHNWLAKCQPPKGTSDGKSLFERNRDNAQEALELLRQRRAATAGGGDG